MWCHGNHFLENFKEQVFLQIFLIAWQYSMNSRPKVLEQGHLRFYDLLIISAVHRELSSIKISQQASKMMLR